MSVDNKCAQGLANDTVKRRRSKAIDMRFHWIRDRVRQGQFIINWAPGSTNLADFFTKNLPTKQFRFMRLFFIRDIKPQKVHILPEDLFIYYLSDTLLTYLRGCVVVCQKIHVQLLSCGKLQTCLARYKRSEICFSLQPLSFSYISWMQICYLIIFMIDL